MELGFEASFRFQNSHQAGLFPGLTSLHPVNLQTDASECLLNTKHLLGTGQDTHGDLVQLLETLPVF